MDEKNGRLGRRNFLLAMGAGGAISAAALVAKPTPQARADAADIQTKKKTRGYQASAHVRNYYRTAKV
jgi:hypothetical protein